ncbi:hypothetical protein BDV95DRAFT_586540 [Massariosphaeria phaeospora]|uniref:BTB domain-containing protein n=1 Tax=Massariosphaeria phaeospora TaxID=100035 RepID=A0A7C8I096_9PLEO|nr:hypothetical protein BDV95DRAFT_586540 [Massariosphaeria phaeospora]
MNLLDPTFFTGGVVDLATKDVTLQAHLLLLCYHSAFFANAVDGSWTKSVEGSCIKSGSRLITLKDADPQTFSQLLSWMYTGKISLRTEKNRRLELCRLWIMADKYQVSTI